MSEPIEVMVRLSQLAEHLDQYSRELGNVERALEPAERGFEEFMADHELGLWNDHIEHGAKLPPQGIRERMGHMAMPRELRLNFSLLVSKRRRIEKRLVSIRAEIDAQRSILSALKSEAEATGAGFRRAA